MLIDVVSRYCRLFIACWGGVYEQGDLFILRVDDPCAMTGPATLLESWHLCSSF